MTSLLVSDRGHHQIISLTDFGKKPSSKLGAKGSGVNQFNLPSGIFVDQTKRIYVADAGNHRVVRMDDVSGKNWKALGINGNAVKQFNQPVAVCIDVKNRIYVADMDNHRIVRMDDMTGKNWTTFGSKGKLADGGGAKLKFYRPTGVHIDSQQRIYIADMGNSRIVRVDDMTGKNWTTFGSAGAEKISSSDQQKS